MVYLLTVVPVLLKDTAPLESIACSGFYAMLIPLSSQLSKDMFVYMFIHDNRVVRSQRICLHKDDSNTHHETESPGKWG